MQGYHIYPSSHYLPDSPYSPGDFAGLRYLGRSGLLPNGCVQCFMTASDRHTILDGTLLQSRSSRWLLILGSLSGQPHGGMSHRLIVYATIFFLNPCPYSTRFRREANAADNKAATVAVDSLINYEAVKVPCPQYSVSGFETNSEFIAFQQREI